MGKQNLGKILRMGLEEAGTEGIEPLEFSRAHYVESNQVVARILSWEKDGKVKCVKRGSAPYCSQYVLRKYRPEREVQA